MKPVFQTRFDRHNGNCWAACLASYFEVPLEEVDHCAASNPDWKRRTDEWLAARGLMYFELRIAHLPESGFTGVPDGAVFIAGTKRRDVWHALLVKATVVEDNRPEIGYFQRRIDFDLIHDPAPADQKGGCAWDMPLHIEQLVIFANLSFA